jgi:hypothetical protein
MKLSKYLYGPGHERVTAMVLTLTCGAASVAIVHANSKLDVFLGGIILAVALFLLRIRVRAFYGLLEIAFGLYVLWNAASEGHGGFSSGFDPGFATFQASILVIQTVGAIYILVRGMDNVFQAFSPEARAKMEARIKAWNI